MIKVLAISINIKLYNRIFFLFNQLNTESNFYNLKFISYTAFDSDEKKKLILDSGADYILNKPVSFKQFKDKFNFYNKEFLIFEIKNNRINK
jgi:response regulator RpfG family c-di-GMP phosphodiesterase